MPLVLLLAILTMPILSQTAPVPTSPSPSPSPTADPLAVFVSGWWVVFVTLITALPWAIVAVWDAIDASYRSRDEIARRLLLSTVCLLLAYVSGIIFSVKLSLQILANDQSGRHDEVATVLVLLVFNLWHVARNLRGWMQFIAVSKMHPFFVLLQTHYGNKFPVSVSHSSSNIDNPKRVCVQGLTQLLISERLFDNEWRKDTPFLSPFFPLRANHYLHPDYEAWGVALWRAWWTQDTNVMTGMRSFTAPDSFPCDAQHRKPFVEDLLSTDPSWPEDRDVVRDDDGQPIRNKRMWAECLLTYGGPEGQQDTHGEALAPVADTANASAVAVLVKEKTTRTPNRMSALWYNTARFQELYESKIEELRQNPQFVHVLFPSWSSWLHIAQDIGTHLPRPVYLSDTHLINFAGELASASIILVAYHTKFRQLVDQIYLDGKNARWTFGWSGLLACFSHLWVKERIYIAMLNGLSLLALTTKTEVKDLDENVRSMLYGYAAFEVSDRAVGRRIANDRKAELLRRYGLNKGKTCRGSGLCATRLACKALEIPAEASHMDGLPAFSTGWCSEYMERKPGNQTPEHGRDHDEVEAREGSSNVWRYPHSHT